MSVGVGKYRRTDLMYFLFLLVAMSIYALHLFSFTVFEGFSTFSSDSFSFIRLARNWSPYEEAALFNLQTVPEHSRSPGFALLLALSGGAESTYVGHLLVSISMLVSIAICGWLAYRNSNWLIGGALTISFCLLPGVIISSMGILSENSYLLFSMTVLLLYSHIKTNPNCRLGWFVVLFLCLTLAMLTRTVGIALVTTLIVVALFDREHGRYRRLFLLVAVMSVSVRQLWIALGADVRVSGRFSIITQIFGNENQTYWSSINFYWNIVQHNVFSLTNAWNHYLSLTSENLWFFMCSFALFSVCSIALILRAVQLKFDALYVFFYLGIVVLWPATQELVRFIHPIVMLLLLQPLLYFRTQACAAGWNRHKTVLLSVIAGLLFNSLIIQFHVLNLKQQAESSFPELVHSVEFYDLLDRDEAVRISQVFRYTMNLIEESAKVIPPGSTVATVKHEAYLLLAGRESVMLTTQVPLLQQLCNFKVRGVDFVFLSPLNSGLVPAPFELANQYSGFSSFILTLDDAQGMPVAHVIKLDNEGIDSTLSEAGYNCQNYIVQ
ncbi:MAG: hypothetical protein ACI9CB_001733 [Rhodothermales bacterium]|jgi:hypothetical protein